MSVRKVSKKAVRLEPINFNDLASSDLSVRRNANQVVARNENILYGRVTLATEAVLRSLDAELRCEPNVGNPDSLPA
jgi:hypothetical protein